MQRKVSFLRPAIQLASVGLAAGALLNYQAILDQYALASFKPAPELSVIESRLALTDQSRALFYRAKPEINGKTQFNQNCETRRGELELGCFYRGRIYILKIENSSLASEMDTVTAHEVLHAAWERMSHNEQAKLAEELQRVYSQMNDAELRQRMSGYAKTEPGEENNELHSILGTEYSQLSPDLEAHYSKYFTDRSKVVAAHAAYKAVFDGRRQELENELSRIRSLKAQLAVINKQLDAYRAAGRIDQYNALVPQQNALVDNINRRIEDYRRGVEEYNALSQSLDSQEITETESSVQ